MMEVNKIYRTYTNLIKLPTFEERFEYLKLNGVPSETTFGGYRSLNQTFYSSPEWKDIRRKVIIRDNGCDLAINDRPISRPNKILIHHLNPVTIDQIINRDPEVFNLNNLITVSFQTHNAIHYGDEKGLIPSRPNERSAGDTCPWR